MSGKKALGQGLDALLGGNIDSTFAEAEAKDGTVRKIAIDKIKPNPDQPRQKFDEDALAELAESIRQQGVIQPILVEEKSDGTCMIIAGERRWRASRQAGLAEVPAIVRRFTLEQRLEIALVENLQREDLSPMEESRAYHHLMDILDMSQQDVADRVGKNRSTVANSLRLLKLPDSMKSAVEDGRLSAGHARAILSLVNPADQQRLFSRIVSQTLSVRASESAAAEMNQPRKVGIQGDASESGFSRDPDMVRIEENFIESLGTKVKVRGNISKGCVEISWFSREDLDRIYALVVSDD